MITPIRAHISIVTYNAIVIGTSDHSIVYPYADPACVYVAIPPASLSTFEVMIPGPITARNRKMRCRHWFVRENPRNTVARAGQFAR